MSVGPNAVGVSEQLSAAIRVAIGGGCGAVLGWERWMAGKLAGLRTHAMVAAASALACVVAEVILGNASEGPRVLAAVFTGVGFIGGGAILQTKSHAHGITTAATVLMASAIGATAGLGAPVLAAAIALGSVLALRIMSWFVVRYDEEFDEP